MVTGIQILIALALAALIAWMILSSSGPADEQRYCLKCGKTSEWHPDRGCLECWRAYQPLTRLNSWRLRRAEKALAEARQQREALDAEDHEYGGLLQSQLDRERRIEQRIADLKGEAR